MLLQSERHLFFLFQAAESGNLDDFKRLFMADNSRIALKDAKGRTAAHQAAARNRVNILRYIRDQNGGKWADKAINPDSLSSVIYRL